MLGDVLSSEDYALGLSPGFFCFYAEMGVVHALEESGALRPTHVSGASAGAIVGGFLASGMKPSEMPEAVFSIERKDIWDVGGVGGLLRGQLLHDLFNSHLRVKKFHECRIPLGITAWDLARFRTNVIQEGDIATAMRASSCFPFLFAPVIVDGTPHIDGGVFDDGGLMALPGVPPSNLVVSVVCGRGRLNSSVLPARYRDCRLITLVLDNMPIVHPFSMDSAGPLAYRAAKAAMHRALVDSHIIQMSHKHWVVYLDGTRMDMPSEIASKKISHPRRPHHFVALSSAKPSPVINQNDDENVSQDREFVDLQTNAVNEVTINDFSNNECSIEKKTPRKRKSRGGNNPDPTPVHGMKLRSRS